MRVSKATLEKLPQLKEKAIPEGDFYRIESADILGKKSEVRFVADHGPGTELHALLGEIGIEPGNCSCAEHIQQMNQNGLQWCAENVETIIDWLQEEARKRGLPFVRLIGAGIVRKALRRAQEKQGLTA